MMFHVYLEEQTRRRPFWKPEMDTSDKHTGKALTMEDSRDGHTRQTTWPASWEICMQVKKQQLELDMEQQTGSK